MMDDQHATPAGREGSLPVAGGRVWYRVLGAGDAIRLLALHGGPGAGPDYLEPLGALAAKRPVVFYDQLGCGKLSPARARRARSGAWARTRCSWAA